MDDAIVVHILKPNQDASYEELRFSLSELLPFVLVVSQVSTSDQVSHQVYVLIVCECVKHVDQESASTKLGREV